MVAISKERADELDVAWQAATDVERLSLNRVEWWSAEKTTYFEVEPSKLEKMAASRIAEIESVMLRVEAWWITDGHKSFDGAPECIFALRDALGPVHRAALLGIKTQPKDCPK
jgi:hypothetical protein